MFWKILLVSQGAVILASDIIVIIIEGDRTLARRNGGGPGQGDPGGPGQGDPGGPGQGDPAPCIIQPGGDHQ